jgi:ABC-type polysaccharide/polyol phosphate export permease
VRQEASVTEGDVSSAGGLRRLGVLVTRERRTRFSGGALAPYWAYLIPVGWIVLVVLAFQFLGRATPIQAPTALFVATGILPYAVFRQVISSLMRAVIANRYLLYFSPISTGDILLASAVLELANALIVATILFAGLVILHEAALPVDLLRVLCGICLAWALGAGFGRLAAALGQWSDTMYRIIPLLLRPMFWLSGVFFTATELGGAAQGLFWWNPLFHAIEILREGFFLGYVSPISSLWYPIACALSLVLISFGIERRVRLGHYARHRL